MWRCKNCLIIVEDHKYDHAIDIINRNMFGSVGIVSFMLLIIDLVHLSAK